jgi:hypothetical protein
MRMLQARFCSRSLGTPDWRHRMSFPIQRKNSVTQPANSNGPGPGDVVGETRSGRRRVQSAAVRAAASCRRGSPQQRRCYSVASRLGLVVRGRLQLDEDRLRQDGTEAAAVWPGAHVSRKKQASVCQKNKPEPCPKTRHGKAQVQWAITKTKLKRGRSRPGNTVRAEENKN